LLTTSPAHSGDERQAYRLDTGDVVEIEVFGNQDFKRRSTVNVDGEIAFPYLPALQAAGLSLAELQASVTGRLVESAVLQNPQVTVEIVEHRPFYVSGDVARPGAIPFRKGLTVRHAVVLAGGYDALRFRAENPLMLAPDLRSKHQALLIDLARTGIKIAAAEAELADHDDFEAPARSADLPVVKQIAEAERRSLRQRMDEWGKQNEYQKGRIEAMESQVANLTASLQHQSDAVKAQAGAADRASISAAKGVTALNRVDEEKRALSQIKTQEVDIRQRLAAANAELAAGKRNKDRQTEERRSALTRAIEDLTVEREKTALDIQACAEKLLYAGAVKAQIDHSASVEVSIYRIVNGARTTVRGDVDTEVQPGDVVDVSIDPEMATAAR
jgi:polysaccharide export outer membrane protein